MKFAEMNRRRFLQTSAAGALAMASGPSLAQTPEPRRGGLLRIGHSGGATSDTIDPATFAAGPVVTAMLGGVCNNLTEIDAEGNAVPELAESIEASPDATVWTFTLRQGVTFSNGRTLTADDVVASYNHHRGPDTTSGAAGLLEQVVDLRADGPNTVVFELASGNADFPFVTADYHLVIMPDDGSGRIDWQAGIGTGGYTLEEHEPGVRISLRRRPDYWKSDRAWFDEVLLRTINDPTARQNALVTGEVDVINGVDTSTVHLLQRRPGIELVEVTGTAHITMPMFCDTPPFDDVNVRLALKYAIDREEIVRTILRGHGRVGNDHPIAPANRFFAGDIEQRVYDPDRARYHLQQAGLESLQVELSTSDAPVVGGVDAAVLFRESAARAGIDITVRQEPEDGYWSNVWLRKPFCVSYWNGRPTEDWMFSLVYAADAEWNESHWTNARFNQLLREARAELDTDRRAEMYREMQELCRDDGGTIIPAFLNYIDGKNDRVAHGPLASNRFLDGWKIVDRWWSAA